MDANLIIKTFENRTGKKVRSVVKYENVANNSVFRIETGSRPYIFKIYRSSDWPEDGKLLFVNRKLNEYKIPHAEILFFDREDGNFPNGYLIEECLPGTTADRLSLTKDETVTLFEQLGVLVSRLHQIKLAGYGYIGGGVAGWTSFSEFICDSLNDNSANLLKHNLADNDELEAVGQEIWERLKVCDKYPPVLCHTDLSTKNMLVNSGEITLIDWDDAYSLCWMADVASLTLWMKRAYGADAGIYRKAFLDNYETGHDKNAFYEVEDILHVRYGLDGLNFCAGKPEYESLKGIVKESLNNCGMRMLKYL